MKDNHQTVKPRARPIQDLNRGQGWMVHSSTHVALSKELDTALRLWREEGLRRQGALNTSPLP